MTIGNPVKFVFDSVSGANCHSWQTKDTVSFRVHYIPATGMVTTQANITFLNREQSTTSLDRTLPTITTDPTLQRVVLIGMPKFEAHSTVSAEPISITKPLKRKSNHTHISHICHIPLCRESAKLSHFI